MVYSISRVGTRALIKTAVLCALSLSVVHADGSSSSTVADICGISDGDKAVGIRAVDDSSCASGGLGCFNDHCRFCKILETPQSSAFENCTDFGAEFPTMAPLVASAGACEVSSGDAAVGISAFTDETCLYGGLGCFNDHCRFCKETETAQSTAFVECPGSSTDGSATSSTGSDTDASDDSSTSAAGISIDTDGCTLVPAPGDIEVGISIGTDETCSAGGLGCISDVCRFCRIRTTAKSAVYADCSFLGTAAANTGTAASTDAPTDAPTETPAATTETPTVVSGTPTATTEAPAVTEAPTATTAAPADSTDAPATTTEAPSTGEVPTSTTAAPVVETTCTITASVGDAAVGINIITDATCVSGGIGCITDVCRFCKVTSSTQSAAFMDCSKFTGDAPTSVPVADNSDVDEGDVSTDNSDTSDASDAVADTPAVATEAPDATTETPAATTTVPDATTETPAATTAVPDATTDAPTAAVETPTATTVPDASTSAPSGPTCSQTASEGDAAVGINIATDASCSSGGVGCIDDICRFCKVTTTTQSAAFLDCAALTGTPSTEAPTEAPTDAPTEAPTDAPADAVTEAPTEAPTDAPTEAPTDAPADAVTEAPTEAPTDAPTDAVTDAPTGEACTQTVSDGDAAVGINIVTDNSCSTGGVGCIDDVCRFCKVSESIQSSAFVECSSITGATNAEALTTENETMTQSIASEASAEYLSGEQIGAAVAGCVGAVAAVAVVARAAKRSSNSTANPNEPSDDDEEIDDTETGKRVSPGPVPTEDPTTTEA